MPSHKGIVHTPEYLRELEAIMSDTPSVDCWGQQGDVVLWHHRLAHMAGHNYSQVIRQAVLHDFNRKDLDLLRLDPPQQDMWRDWSSEVRATETLYSKTFAEEQRLPAKLLEKTA
jgi:ectoine hydroxylase-related dioxygenase (phytanoyl-CoA dioxygenase family)